MFSIVRSTSDIWTRSLTTITSFQEARVAFEDITRTLSKATLNTYWAFVNSDGTKEDYSNPTRYDTYSNLQFVIRPTSEFLGDPARYPGQSLFFQAPLGRVNDANSYLLNKSLLNTIGYFVEFGDDTDVPPFVRAENRSRYRLMRLLEPSEKLEIYKSTSPATAPGQPATSENNPNNSAWYENAISGGNRPVHPLAENIIALVLIPQLPARDDPTGLALAGSRYDFNSARPLIYNLNGRAQRVLHQLPPIVQVTMVAVDEKSMGRLITSDTPPDLGISLGSLFQDPANYEADLENLCTALAEKNISYRVFTSKVPIQGAKWSVE